MQILGFWKHWLFLLKFQSPLIYLPHLTPYYNLTPKHSLFFWYQWLGTVRYNQKVLSHYLFYELFLVIFQDFSHEVLTVLQLLSRSLSLPLILFLKRTLPIVHNYRFVLLLKSCHNTQSDFSSENKKYIRNSRRRCCDEIFI